MILRKIKRIGLYSVIIEHHPRRTKHPIIVVFVGDNFIWLRKRKTVKQEKE
jgi:hypothetical protein